MYALGLVRPRLVGKNLLLTSNAAIDLRKVVTLRRRSDDQLVADLCGGQSITINIPKGELDQDRSILRWWMEAQSGELGNYSEVPIQPERFPFELHLDKVVRELDLRYSRLLKEGVVFVGEGHRLVYIDLNECNGRLHLLKPGEQLRRVNYGLAQPRPCNGDRTEEEVGIIRELLPLLVKRLEEIRRDKFYGGGV